jgi:hypothetical protein
MFLLFSHNITDKQIEDAKLTLDVDEFVEIPENLQEIWSQVSPEGDLPIEDLNKIIDWLKGRADKNDIVLVQGDFGAVCYMVSACFNLNLIPVYSTTNRFAIENKREDGSIEKRSIFEHICFRKYVIYQ